MFENEYLNFDNLFNDDIDNSDFDFATEASKPDSSEFALQLRREQAINNNPKYIGRTIIYTFLAVFGVTAPIAIIMLLDWAKKSKTAITYGGWRFDEACDALKEIAKLESKREGALSSSNVVKIKQYEKLLEEIDKDRKLKGDPSIKASFNKILKEISKNPGSKEYKELMKILPKKETVDKVLDSAILDYDCSDLDEYDDFDDDFEFEQDVLALEDAISMLVDEDEREDEFDRAVDEIEEINHPVDEILDEATESTGLFDTSTPAISNGLFEDLFKPATEAVEDDDEDGDLLEEDDGDDDFSDDELDGYVEPKQDYSDKEYDRDEALEEDF